MILKMSDGILGKLSWKFQNPYGQIYDNVKSSILSLWPAGYSQSFLRPCKNIPDACEKINRQELFKALYKVAESQGTELERWPLKEYSYKIHLEHEPTNRWDENAIKIMLVSDEGKCCMGYIPSKINSVLLENLERIDSIQIETVTDTLNKKFYCAKLEIFYDGCEKFNEVPQPEAGTNKLLDVAWQ